MRCSACDKMIARHDRFCRYCGQAVVIKQPSVKLPTPGNIVTPIEYNDFGSSELLAQFESPSGSAWGAHIYTGSSCHQYDFKTIPAGCPEWLDNNNWFRWLRRGLVVWDHDTHRIGAVLAHEAIELLEKLRESDEWKTQGIAVIERHPERISFAEPSLRKTSRKKKGVEPASPAEELKSESKVCEEERLRLTGQAAEEFLAYLQANEPQLRKMADEEEKLEQVVRKRIFDLMVQIYHQHEWNEFDGSGRKFLWVRQEYPQALICDIPPDRATLQLVNDSFWWQPIIERPNHLKLDYERFFSLKEALDWVEQKIPELHAQDEEIAKKLEQERADEEAKIAALPRMDLTSYWIDPSALEPERVTYRVLIELEYEAYSCQKTEISFGEFWRFGKEFYTPTMLARELQLASNSLDIKQPSRDLGWYYIRSTVTYYDAHLVAAQAQQLWDKSAIVEQYQAHKVLRARYGFEEAETEYCVWIGGLEKPGNPWPTPETRTAYLTRQALQETLLYALDVNGYRQFTKMPYKYVNDAKLLEYMYKARAESRYLPAGVRTESQRWLSEHGL